MAGLPAVGEVYWVETWIFGGSDPKDERPVVIVKEPRDALGRVHAIARTSDTEVNGVGHPADPELELDKDGVFALKYHRSAEAVIFLPPQVRFVGVLPEPYLGHVLDMWDKG